MTQLTIVTQNDEFEISYLIMSLREVEYMMLLKICSDVQIEGLETLDYFDNLMNRSRFTEQADAITFDGEV